MSFRDYLLFLLGKKPHPALRRGSIEYVSSDTEPRYRIYKSKLIRCDGPYEESHIGEERPPKRYEFDGFTITLIQFDDRQWLAHFVELPDVSASAPTPGKAIQKLHSEWKKIKKSCTEQGVPIPEADGWKLH